MATHHRLVGDMICCCGWEDSPQAFRWSRELPALGYTRPVKNMTSINQAAGAPAAQGDRRPERHGRRTDEMIQQHAMTAEDQP